MKQFKKTAIALGLAQMAAMSGMAVAQTAPADSGQTVIVTGQRAALQSAQKIKQNSDEIVDSIVADDIGKLPDRSVTEVLQRIVGVTIDRTMSKGDPEHFSVEGSGVSIRGLSYVRSELNGRDSFSANGGRSLNFEDVPPELMAGVDIYKNPSAEQVEGAVGGLVNLRTAMPFDFKGFHGAISGQETYSELKKGKSSPSMSGMVSNRWKTPIGEVGALLDLAYSESGTRTDAFQVEPYYPLKDAAGKTIWVPKGAQWRTLEFNRRREGAYGALQWKANDQLSSSLTYFKSRYTMTWDEQAIFAQSSPYNIQVTNGTYDSKGALLTGTLTDTKDGGINFGDDTRSSTRKSDTTDLSWNLRWRPNDRWTVTTDLQHIRASTRSLDSTVATGVQMPKEQLDLTGNVPNLIFDAADRANLADPKNYYWAFTMEHQDKSVGHETAWKTDAKYDFDHPVLRDIRFGVRLTDRDALTQNTNPSYNWSPISQPWQLGWNISGLAYLSDPRFSGNTNLHTFNNFFNGKVSVPSVVFPNVSLAQGFPDSYAALHKYHDILCAEVSTSCDTWKAATFGTDPSGTNDQTEKTQALYSQVRFGWDNLKYPIDGNVGVRYVKTASTAHGYTVFKSTAPNIPAGNTTTGVTVPVIAPFSKAEDYENNYHNVLPSLNLRMKASDTLQFRFAFAGALSRPDFDKLQAYTEMEQTASTTTNTATNVTTINSVSQMGKGSGNPYLKPTTSRQMDLTAEWYFAPAGSFTAAVFNKQLKDIIVNQTYLYAIPDVNGVKQNFAVTGPINGAKGHARGIELAYQQYFDKLPGLLSGLGLQANFTFVDSKRDLYKPVYQAYCTSENSAANVNLTLNGCDTNGTTFGNLPLENLSRQSFNLALMYDKGPWSARLAYNWRSKSLQAVNVNGTQGTDGTDTNPASPDVGKQNVVWGLPVWADAYGQLDASMFYKINEHMSLGFEAQNVTNSQFKQLMQQSVGMKGRAWFVTGPRYTAQLRYTF
ncbi:TonB-dependent receptor [Duganella violaceipulchra]|uniref:TonB-dependent receptor n=1 Tax=Duganella violaceipulchra TaxID=2849652 RepID=A0AA41HAM7_9BURK|nr:TonB-dependent receptor [Duganella violaceicalia]MBV6325068.1 TonB-dependent receptor [Duganella violaceicalia]MCP2010580.1 TonB-dependent receptor [Duganella violaceicalia]